MRCRYSRRLSVQLAACAARYCSMRVAIVCGIRQATTMVGINMQLQAREMEDSSMQVAVVGAD